MNRRKEKSQRGGAAFEYIWVIVIVALVAILATYWYRTHIVQKGFEKSVESLETGQDLVSGEFTRETDKVSNIKFSGPMLLAVACIVILMMILFSTFKAAKKAKRGVKDLNEDRPRPVLGGKTAQEAYENGLQTLPDRQQLRREVEKREEKILADASSRVEVRSARRWAIEGTLISYGLVKIEGEVSHDFL